MNEWLELIANSFQSALQQIIDFFPKLIGAILLLLTGWLAAKFIEKVFNKIFNLIGINRISEKSGIDGLLSSFSIRKEFSWILSRLLFWAILFIFFLPISEILGLSFFADLVNQIISFLPNIVIALIILLTGSWASKIISGLVKGSANRIGSEYADLTGTIIYMMIMLITIVITLFQLKIEIGILSYILISIFGALAFGLALAFALGVKDIIKIIVLSAYLKQSLAPGTIISLKNIQGEVIECGRFFTIIKTDKSTTLSIPNSYFIEKP